MNIFFQLQQFLFMLPEGMCSLTAFRTHARMHARMHAHTHTHTHTTHPFY